MQLIGGPLDGADVDLLIPGDPIRIPEIRERPQFFILTVVTGAELAEALGTQIRYHIYTPGYHSGQPVMTHELTTAWETIPWRPA